MNEHKINEPVKTSSNTKEFGVPNETYSVYDDHYNKPFYVDKTLLIKELFEIKHVLITAPSRFGKTLNMDMVRRFVEIELDKDGKPIVLDVDEDKCCLKEIQPRSKNFKLFQGKNISKEKEIIFKHFGKYPTIYVNFAGVQGSDFEQNLASDELKSGLQILSKFLHSYYGRKVFVFIEDFDAPVNAMVYENEMTPEDRYNMGQSSDEASVRALAKSINALFKSGEPPRNEFEFQSQLHGRMYREFQLDSTDGDVCTKYISASGDLLLVMRPHRVGCIIKFKFPEDETMTSSEAFTQIKKKKYVLDEESLKILFRQNTPIVEKRIYLGILYE
ncbi:hypothetical protein PV326_004937 [Microctonus aethiopoides]|nr:hypothetical protein PV326_004937 [Microctonus aethiopoides]